MIACFTSGGGELLSLLIYGGLLQVYHCETLVGATKAYQVCLLHSKELTVRLQSLVSIGFVLKLYSNRDKMPV